VVGVTGDPNAPKERDDTPRETPLAKGSDPPIKIDPGSWEPPRGPTESMPRESARVDFALGGARVHTFQAKGPLGLVLALIVLLVVGAIFALMFTFAVGAGAALAAGAVAVGGLGYAARRVRRALGAGVGRGPGQGPRLPASRGEKLDGGGDEP
jgi:hypothetical protein